jgi:hypothetical protein
MDIQSTILEHLLMTRRDLEAAMDNLLALRIKVREAELDFGSQPILRLPLRNVSKIAFWNPPMVGMSSTQSSKLRRRLRS